VVSFSGGRDSAAVLAVATALARREGLTLPIPATNTFTAEQGADESSWQEMLIEHLGLSDWVRLEYSDELDLIGPYAQRVLRAHGLLWPANVHFHLPLLELARNGSLLTGVGGDELFMAARRLRSGAVLSRAVSPRPRDILSLSLAYAPRALRRAVIARRATLEAPWLLGPAMRLVIELLASEAAAEPRRLKQRLPWWRQLRYLDVGTASLGVLASDTETLILHPLLAAPFWTAVAREGGPHGFADRTEGMRCLFGDVLPAEIVQRGSKTNLDKVFWTERSRAFARGWDGSGVPLEWVDAHQLARHWASSNPSVPSSFLLQAAWLASGS
jgi:asparagine synthase (glutamine-hydrolysing)